MPTFKSNREPRQRTTAANSQEPITATEKHHSGNESNGNNSGGNRYNREPPTVREITERATAATDTREPASVKAYHSNGEPTTAETRTVTTAEPTAANSQTDSETDSSRTNTNTEPEISMPTAPTERTRKAPESTPNA